MSLHTRAPQYPSRSTWWTRLASLKLHNSTKHPSRRHPRGQGHGVLAVHGRIQQAVSHLHRTQTTMGTEGKLPLKIYIRKRSPVELRALGSEPGAKRRAWKLLPPPITPKTPPPSAAGDGRCSTVRENRPGSAGPSMGRLHPERRASNGACHITRAQSQIETRPARTPRSAAPGSQSEQGLWAAETSKLSITSAAW